MNEDWTDYLTMEELNEIFQEDEKLRKEARK